MNSIELQTIFEHFKDVHTVAGAVDVFAELPAARSAIEIEMRIFAFRKVIERLFERDRTGVEALQLEIEAMKKLLGSEDD